MIADLQKFICNLKIQNDQLSRLELINCSDSFEMGLQMIKCLDGINHINLCRNQAKVTTEEEIQGLILLMARCDHIDLSENPLFKNVIQPTPNADKPKDSLDDFLSLLTDLPTIFQCSQANLSDTFLGINPSNLNLFLVLLSTSLRQKRFKLQNLNLSKNFIETFYFKQNMLLKEEGKGESNFLKELVLNNESEGLALDLSGNYLRAEEV